jgi:hypothetical protein
MQTFRLVTDYAFTRVSAVGSVIFDRKLTEESQGVVSGVAFGGFCEY